MTPRQRCALAALVLAFAALPAAAQAPGPKSAASRVLNSVLPQADTAARPRAADTVVTPIPPAEVPAAADQVMAATIDLLTSTSPSAGTQAVLAGVQALLDSLEQDEPVASLAEQGVLTRRGLTDIGLMWSARDRMVRDWRRELRQAAAQVDSARRQVRRELVVWRTTLADTDTVAYTPALRQRAENVVARLGEVDSVLAVRNGEILAAELGLSDANGRIFTELQSVATARAEARQNLLRRDSPPLWKSPLMYGASGVGRETRSHLLQELRWFMSRTRTMLIAQVLLTLLAVLLALRHRHDLQRTAEHEVPTGPYYDVLRHPVAAVALLGITATLLVYPLAPLPVYDVGLIGAAVPLLLLIPTLVPADLVTAARLAVGLFVLQRSLSALLMGTLPYRMVLLGVSLLAVVLLWQGLRPAGVLKRKEPQWRRTLQHVGWALLACGAVAVVANVIGNVTLADAVNAGIALTLYLAILFAAATQIAEVLLSQVVRKGAAYSRYLRDRGDRVLRVSGRVLYLLAGLLWLALSLQSFYLWGPLASWFTGVFGTPIRIGEAALSLGTVVLFVLVLWAGVLIARLVSGVLELDVLGRMNVRRGVPVTVGSLVRYLLIAVAFLTALAATGVELSRFAILGGALGVGIGFGMQNIVNNFVSGLLLAVERPVSVGDTVQVGLNTGEIREIGIRASVIRTFEGAEVIVPNSELITQDVINWTRTGTRRRIEVTVGVAYGNDPARVIGLLADVAQAHPEVLGNPAAFALFTGFGANSLDFVVRAWTDSNDWIIVRSDIAVSVHGALRESGIEIPFPQRDVHLKSADPGALKHLQQEDGDAH